MEDGSLLALPPPPTRKAYAGCNPMTTAETTSAPAVTEAPQAETTSTSVATGLALEPRILDEFAVDLQRLGVVGEKNIAKLTYLCLVSRLTEKPISVVITGPSASGKSYVGGSVLKFFPESAYLERTGMSEKALMFSDEKLKHRFLVLFEADGLREGWQEYMIRSLLSEGVVKYEI